MESVGLYELNWALIDFRGNLGRDCVFHWPGSPCAQSGEAAAPAEVAISFEGILKLRTARCSWWNRTLFSRVDCSCMNRMYLMTSQGLCCALGF